MIGVWLGVACAPLRAVAPPAVLPPCEPAPAALAAQVAAGLTLDVADARVMFPGLGLDPALVRTVEVRAAPSHLCGGWLVGEHVRVRVVGPRGVLVEAAIGTTVRAGPVLGVTQDDARVDVPAAAWRIVSRDTLAREAPTVLGVYSSGGGGASASSSASSPSRSSVM